MTTAPVNNYTLTTNLDSIKSYPWGNTKTITGNSSKICDSHTSYRRLLEETSITLKMQLAEAQERADTLQNDLNLFTNEWRTNLQSLHDLETRYTESQRLSEGLATVVTHLQSNAKDSAAERSALRVEIQGLKSENEWFKNERFNKGYGDADGAGSILEGLPVISELRNLLTPSKSNKSQETPTVETSAATNSTDTSTTDDNDDDSTLQINTGATPPSKSKIKLKSDSGVDRGILSNDDEGFDPYSMFKKKVGIRARGNVEVPDNGASVTNSVISKQQRNRDNGASVTNPVTSKQERDRGLSPPGGGSVDGEEKVGSTGDLPERWQDCAVSSSSRNNENVNNDDAEKVSAAELPTVIPPTRKWWWKNENDPENINPVSSTVSEQPQQPQPQPQPQPQQRRTFTPWFLNTNTDELSLPPPTRTYGSGSIDENESSTSSPSFWNTLVPRRPERPV